MKLASACILSLLATPALAAQKSNSVDLAPNYAAIISRLADLSLYVTSCPFGGTYREKLDTLTVETKIVFKRPSLDAVDADITAKRHDADDLFTASSEDVRAGICTKLRAHFNDSFVY